MFLPLSVNNLSGIGMFFGMMCNFRPAKIISGYSEYANEMNSDQRALITSAALEVVTSFAGNTPIVAILVVGHADTALRKPLHDRSKFEMDVSIHRAQAATRDLKAEIERLGRGKSPEPIKIVKFGDPVGMGATKKLVSNARNESLMKLNRRVEIHFAQCIVPPQWTWRDAALRGEALVKPDTDARKRILCMLDKILRVADVQDGYFNYQVFKSLFFPPGSTEQQKRALLTKHISHLEEDLGRRANFGPATEVPNDLFIQNLESIDEVITRSMRDFKFASEQSGTSELVVRAWKVIQISRTEPKSVYNCYASYSW